MAANIIVGTALAALIFLAARKVVKDRKKGVGSCGMNCSSCQRPEEGSRVLWYELQQLSVS